MADEDPKAVSWREFFDADEADERVLIREEGKDYGYGDGNGGEAAKILLLEQEIEVLRREKAELGAEAEAKAAEARTIASHVLNLEGEIVRLREDLIHEESTRSNFETDFTELRRRYMNLEQEKALKVGELEGKIFDLEKELQLIDSRRHQEVLAATEDMQAKMAAKEKAAEAEMLALEQSAALGTWSRGRNGSWRWLRLWKTRSLVSKESSPFVGPPRRRRRAIWRSMARDSELQLGWRSAFLRSCSLELLL